MLKKWACPSLCFYIDDLFGDEEEEEKEEVKEVVQSKPVVPIVTERVHKDSDPPTLEPDEPAPPTVDLTPAVTPPTTTSTSGGGGDLFDEEEEEPKPKPTKPVSVVHIYTREYIISESFFSKGIFI